MTAPSSLAPLDIAILHRIHDVAEAEWDAVFPGEPERWAYLRAVEDSKIEGFRLFYVTVRREGVLLAAAPGFLTDYHLDTTVQGPMRPVVSALAKALPFLMRLRLASLGSPVTETAALGVLPGQPRPQLIAALYEGLERKAKADGVRLLAVKDVPNAQFDARGAARTAGLNPMSSLPAAVLDMAGITSEEAYWERLSYSTRKDFRRKLKKAGGIGIERLTDLAPHANDIDRLYEATRARSDLQFERLTWRYFQAVLEQMGDDAALFLYSAGGEAIGFNLLIGSGGAWVDKYFCADARGPEHNLYVVSWLQNVRFAMSRGAHRLVAGQTAYEVKLKFGCRLEPTTIFFRHRWWAANAILALASRYLGAEETDPTLRRAPGMTPAMADGPLPANGGLG